MGSDTNHQPERATKQPIINGITEHSGYYGTGIRARPCFLSCAFFGPFCRCSCFFLAWHRRFSLFFLFPFCPTFWPSFVSASFSLPQSSLPFLVLLVFFLVSRFGSLVVLPVLHPVRCRCLRLVCFLFLHFAFCLVLLTVSSSSVMSSSRSFPLWPSLSFSLSFYASVFVSSSLSLCALVCLPLALSFLLSHLLLFLPLPFFPWCSAPFFSLHFPALSCPLPCPSSFPFPCPPLLSLALSVS